MNWFLTKIRYTKQLENGSFKRVNEKFLFAATSFADAEARIYEELGPLIRGELAVQAIERKVFQDVLMTDDCDVFWIVKVVENKFDADASKTKKTKYTFLFSSTTAKGAAVTAKDFLSVFMDDFHISSVSESGIEEIFPFPEVEGVFEESNSSKDDLSFLEDDQETK